MRKLAAAILITGLLTGGCTSPQANSATGKRKHIVFILAEDEYKTEHTLPAFAGEHLQAFRCTFLEANPADRNDILIPDVPHERPTRDRDEQMYANTGGARRMDTGKFSVSTPLACRHRHAAVGGRAAIHHPLGHP